MSKQIIYTDNKDPLLVAYMKDIRSFPIYPNEEINKFIMEAKTGNTKARDKIIKSNLRFVITLAKKFQGRGVPLIDLISEGNIGISAAIDHFNPDLGVPFISYAAYWIKLYIYQSIYQGGRTIRLPVNQQIKIVKIVQAEQQLLKELGRTPSTEEIASKSGIPPEDIDYLAQFATKLVSVDDSAGKDEDSGTVLELIQDKREDVEKDVNKSFIYQEINTILSCLGDREHDIIVLLFGIGCEPLPGPEIGQLFGIGNERIRQIKDKALYKLRHVHGKRIKNCYNDLFS